MTTVEKQIKHLYDIIASHIKYETILYNDFSAYYQVIREQNNGEYTYHTSTHYNGSALRLVLNIKNGRKELSPVKNPDGRICEDATSEQVAEVMVAIWQDALERIKDFDWDNQH